MNARHEPAATNAAPPAADAARVRRPLFRKYFIALLAAVETRRERDFEGIFEIIVRERFAGLLVTPIHFSGERH